ncbi:hypothetical protein ACDX32_27300 [Klebsiella quasipneumoniae]
MSKTKGLKTSKRKLKSKERTVKASKIKQRLDRKQNKKDLTKAFSKTI